MSRDIVLAIHMTAKDYEQYLNSPDGFLCERELHQSTIENFCRARNIPYAYPFVSVAVYETLDNVKEGLASGFGMDDNSLSLPVAVILRNENVLPRLMVVCSDDFHTTAYNAAKHTPKNTRDRPKQFTVLSELSDEESASALYAAKRRSNRYAEARLHGSVFMCDVDTERTQVVNPQLKL